MNNIFAYTEPNVSLPAYISVNDTNGKLSVIIRSTGKQESSEIVLDRFQLAQLGVKCLTYSTDDDPC